MDVVILVLLKQLKFEIFGHIPLFYIPLPPLENIYLCNPLFWNSSNFHSDHDLRRDPRVGERRISKFQIVILSILVISGRIWAVSNNFWLLIRWAIDLEWSQLRLTIDRDSYERNWLTSTLSNSGKRWPKDILTLLDLFTVTLTVLYSVLSL